MKLIFEWDERKGRDNRTVHKVGFEEAKAVFNDPLLISFPDEVHSVDEERLLSIGTSDRGRVLLVVHTESYEGWQYRRANNQRQESNFIRAESL